MFHVKPEADGFDVVRRAARWAGADLSADAEAKLARYAQWLRDEAVPAGGLGPEEVGRIAERHLADSLTFARPWRDRNIAALADIGSGAGLPGIPLAIVFPNVEVTLLDRAGRRVDLMRRATRILELENVVVQRADILDVEASWNVVTMRAVLPLATALGQVRRLLAPGGVGVIGVAHAEVAPDVASGAVGTELVEVPPGVLDSRAWLLEVHIHDD